MALELNVAGDFATILDGLEAVVVKRQHTPETIPVAKAWRYVSKVEEAELGGADYTRHDVVWQLPWDEANDPPRLGDRIIDEAGLCWTILSVERPRLDTRFRCLARNLHLAFGLNTLVDVQLADVDDLSSRLESVSWITVQASVPARILLDRTKVALDPGDDEQAPAVTSAATCRVILGDQIELNHNHRLVDAEGTIYDVVEYANFGRIDRLPVATVIRQAEGS